MQSQHLKIPLGQLLDQTTNSIIKVQNGHFVIHNLETGSKQQYLLPPLKFKDQKTTYGLPLKFISKSNNIQLNPTGNILICKSLTFQQVEMSRSYNKEIAYWSLYLPHRCSSFSVGIKSSQLKKSYAFDFSINKPTVLTFKVDLEQKVFTCWLNDVRSQWHKPIQIQTDSQWTPFVRVKNIGTQIILNSLVTDPESSIVSYVNSNKSSQISIYTQPQIQLQSQSDEIQQNTQSYSLQKITNNKILLIGQNHIKLLTREQTDKQQFNLSSFSQFAKNDDNKIILKLTQNEFQQIDRFSKKSHTNLLTVKLSKNNLQENQLTISLTANQWRQQLIQALRILNTIKQAAYQNSKNLQNSNRFNNISIQQADNIAKIILQKAQLINPYLQQKIHSTYSQFNTKFNNVQTLPFFQQTSTPFTIPKSLTINNYPFIKFNSQIINVKSTSNFVACLLKDINRISILNVSSIPFKLIDTIISRGFIKQTEINQYKKQVEDINDSDFTKPHIFKILKNCLKYADKIKPPMKLLKQLQKKKEEIKEKEVKKQASLTKQQKKLKTPSSIQPDKQLLTSLISMGFNHKLSAKVLTQCKNQSIEAALQLILTKYPHQNQQTFNTTKIQSLSIKKPKRQWQCELCTLINSKDVATCSACDTAAPQEAMIGYDEIQMIDNKVKQEEENKHLLSEKQQQEKQISSSNIDNQTVKDFFIWHTKVAYCPLLIAAVFETKIRFRLLGPNPKFYSNFYIKDNGYFDLTTLKYHEFAHQINQQQINDMFFLTSSAQEQRKMNWGWMNIQDWDYDITKNICNIITKIDFNSIKVTNKHHKFTIQISTENNIKTLLNCQIMFDNVYEQRKRCFIVKDVNFSEQIENNIVAKQDTNNKQQVLQKKQKYIDQNKLVISSKSRVVCDFVKQVPITNQQTQTNPLSTLLQQQKSSLVASSSTLAPLKTDLIPLIAISGPYSSTLGYPTCQLQQLSGEIYNPIKCYKNGLVFRHVHNNKFLVKSVKIQRQSSSKAQNNNNENKGYFYLTNDLSLEPLIKHQFEFNQNQSKTIINLANIYNNNQHQQASYIVVVLTPRAITKQQQSQPQSSLINKVSVYGSVVPSSISSSQRHIDISNLVKDRVRIIYDSTSSSSQQEEQVNIKCQLINYPYDLLSLESSNNNNNKQSLTSTLLQSLINNNNNTIPINIRVILLSQQKQPLTISQIKLQHFTLISSHTQYTKQQLHQRLTIQQYKSCLHSFIATFDTTYYNKITNTNNTNNQHQQYRKLISQVQLKQFITSITVLPSNKVNEITTIRQFIKQFAYQLSQNQILSNEDVLKTALRSQELTPAGAEIMFQLIKLVKGNNNFSMLQSQLSYHLSELREKKTSIIYKNLPSQSYHKQQTIFSPLLHKLSSTSTTNKLTNNSSQLTILETQQPTPAYHFTCIKHPQGRKYTIDMMSLYSINEIQLKVINNSDNNTNVRSKQYAIIEVAYIDDNNGQQVIVQRKFIDEYIWSQLLTNNNISNNNLNNNNSNSSSVSGKASSPSINHKSSSSQMNNKTTSLFLTYNNKSITTRYLTINLTFTAIPNHNLNKQLQSSLSTSLFTTTSLQIIPIVHGIYKGESQPVLQQHFQFTSSLMSVHDNVLQLVKKVDNNFAKYSNKTDQKMFYYTSLLSQQSPYQNTYQQNEKLSGGINYSDNIFSITQHNEQTKQAITKRLLQSPSSHNNFNYNFTMSYLIITAMIDQLQTTKTITNNQLFSINNNIIREIIQQFINNERGALMQKAVVLLRKLIVLIKGDNTNNILTKVLQSPITNEHMFNNIFKDLINKNQQQHYFNTIKQLITVDNFVKHHSLPINLSHFAKLYTLDQETIELLTKTLYQSGHLQQSIIVFVKYGWTKDTINILDKLITKNMHNNNNNIHIQNIITPILSSSKHNTQLSLFAHQQLTKSSSSQQNQQIFNLVISELSKKHRHTKVNDIKNILYEMMQNIKTSQQQDDQEKRQQFLSILGLINKFGYTSEIAEQVIRIFFKLQQKNAYLHQLLTCVFMKQQHIIQHLINIALTQQLSLIQSTKKTLKQQDIILLNDILCCVLSKQINIQTSLQPINFTLHQNIEKTVLKFFSTYLKHTLMIGGLESAKMSDQLMTQKIKIAFYLSIMVKNDHLLQSIDENILVNLINWLLVNITVSSDEKKHPKTPNCNRFLRIQQTVWKIIQQKGNKQHKLFAQLYMQSYKRIKQQSQSIINVSIRNECLRKLYVCNNRVLEKFVDKSQLLQVLSLQNGLFEEMLAEFSKLQSINIFNSISITSNTSLPSEQQLVNQLSLQNSQPNKKPTDWLLYKNGSKNHIYKIQYYKNTQQQIDLTFSLQQQFTLTKVIFAFKLDAGTNANSNGDKNICLPKSIRVEGGMTIDKLRHLGEMFQIKDDRYYNLSTKLYGLNMNVLKDNKVTIQKQYNKNLPIKYLRFRIRAPQPISIQDVLQGAQIIDNDSKVSLVNFLSIQGMKLKHAQPNINELVRLLELLTLPSHRQLINKLFNNQAIIKQFNKALTIFSQVMKLQQHNKTIHNFLMRVCQQNTSIGNQMLLKYLSIKNPQICSKIATEIVLANDQQLKDRVTLMFEFIQKVTNKNILLVIDKNILPFMNRFTQIAYYTTTRQNYNPAKAQTEIQLNILQSTIAKLLEELQRNQQSSQIISKFFSTILTLNKPFVISGFAISDVLKKIAQRKNAHFDQLLTALVINSDDCRKWFMENSLLENIFNQTFQLIKTSKDVAKIVSNISLITTLSLNYSIKLLINKQQYNLKMFELLMGKNTQAILSAVENKLLRKSFVDLIARTSLGSENQAVIGQLLKDSIPNIISQGNQKFVGEIFLPLLNSFEKIPVCVLPYVQNQNKLITDFSNIDFKTDKNQKTTTKSQQKQISGFRLPSSLVSEEIKQKIFDELIKNQYQNGKFNLAQSHGNFTDGLGQPIIKNILLTNRPFIIIIKVKSHRDPSLIRTICIFYNRTDENQNKFNLKWTKGTFIMFVDYPSKLNNNTQKIITLSKQPKQQKNKLILEYLHYELNTNSDYDQQGDQYQSMVFRYNGNLFGQIGYGGCNFNSFDFQQIQVFTDTEIQGNWQPESVEYWSFYSSKQSTKDKIQQKSTLPELTKSLLQTNYDHTLFSSAYKASTTLNTLRYETVYEFPASLTVRQLKQSMRIINCSIDDKQLKNLKLTLKGNQTALAINDDMTLEQIKKLSKSKDNIILDLNVHVDNLLDVLNLKSPFKRQQVDFLPKKGILKYFEQNEGIQSMIKVIKKSIEGWKNKAKMEKWLQYVIELENFSHFPHFFAIYLKDKQTFDLLFNLLAGLPDKETNPKWDALQASSSQKLLKIVSEILHMDKTSQFREYALKNNFFITILQRLRLLTGIFKRKYDKDYKQEQEQQKSPTKVQTQDDGTKKIKKKKGVGYGNDTSSNTKWMKGDNMQERKRQFETVRTILGIIENFLDVQSSWKISDILLQNIYESALLPFIEDGLRAGTLLQISKHPQKFKAIFDIIRVLSRHQQLIPVLLPIDQKYQPRQIQSIESLLKSLENISSIFLSCLANSKTTQTTQQKMSAQLAMLIKDTYKSVEQAIDEYKQNHLNDDTQQKQLQEILQLPLDKKYRLLLKDLRFDYIDMKQSPNKIKHHYSSSFTANYTPNQNKMIRLAQQLADISTALPHQHTNAIYVRCDKDRVDFMQALIMGSNGTAYGHGAFLFDVYFDDNYPNNPPKVNLTTTGHGKVRFNPNLYACGKVCLSLLGTWRGSASENWDAKVSTLLQVLLSIQAIIMSEQIYFNEPGFENQQGTQQGEKKNEAYSNIVRYCNIKFAMIENIRNPPKGFETIIRRHFYLKKGEIMQECRKWQKYAQKRPANYIGLVNDHNHSWSNEFKKSKTQYKQMLDQAIKQLQEQLNKLPAPKITDIITTKQAKKQSKKKVTINKMQQLQKQQNLQQIDVSYDKSLMSTESKQIDITDQKVKDRWSRYIGAMGIDAVSKQSKADILVFGLNPLALEVVKNLVLSGCRRLTICDDKLVSMQDLSGGFFYTLEDVGKKRVQSILYKIRELNVYVKIDTIPSFEHLTPVTLKNYSLVLATELCLAQQLKISNICREQKIKFISADCIGFTGRIVNDLGEKFEVLDKNGQEPVQVFAKDITISEKGVVTLLDGLKNPFEDGQAVLIRNVQGMNLKDGDKAKSINDTIHKVKVINSKSFEIGNTLNYTPYIRSGTIKNIKTPVEITYKPFKQIVIDHKNISVDENLAFYDFSKLQNSKLVKCCYLALEEFKKKNETRHPEPWNLKDMTLFVDIFKTINEEDVDEKSLKFVEKFALTSKGYLPPLCAFFGGLVCQQIIKAITQKYKPINSQFYIQFSEIVPELPQQINENSLKQIFSYNKNSRDIGLQMVIGNHLLQVIKNSKLFMIGSGAIGCQLLKNFAMIGFGTGEKGKITLTDPDHIQNSNLNRQFLFRQKHISKSKSRTASEAVKVMNNGLKNHITALTQRVSDSTKDIFTNKFFQGLTLVANALDNVAARRYVDQRCVENKIPLFQSGTLGPKGHVQVIIPYLTESYGSQNDPVQEGEIPHCTLKMFPEETLHCIQWARDIFGKKFSLLPKAMIKIIDKSYKPEKDDIKSLSDCVTMVKKCPKTFEDCINYAIHKFYKYYRDDVMQLLYTYPLDSKTKNGEPFWKLPKRPPTPIMQFDPENILQCTFVTSLAVMIAKIYQVDYPKNFRTQAERLFIGKQASKIKMHEFVPSDEKAKEILKQSSEKKEQNVEQQKMQEVMQEKDESQLYKEIIKTGGHQFKIKVQEFEKDDDSNGHIDFIYSMANLRAINYKLDQMDWINVKIKAGRIVPALATTTACVSGLQTLEICKYLKKIKIDLMKNSYLNLAVPSIQMSQPGQVLKTKITDKLTVNLWDRWEVVCEKSSTFGELYEKLFKKYEIFPIGVLQGMSRIDTGKSQQAKKQFMKEKILDKLDIEDNYIDIIVLFTKTQQDEKIIQGIPPIRLLFN